MAKKAPSAPRRVKVGMAALVTAPDLGAAEEEDEDEPEDVPEEEPLLPLPVLVPYANVSKVHV